VTQTTAATTDHWFMVHGVGVHYSTSAPMLVEPALALLRHFQDKSPSRQAASRIRFEAVDSRAEIPVMVPPSARLLSSAEGSSIREGTRTKWECVVVQDGRQLIANFHADGLIVIDMVERIVEGYLVRPQESPPGTVEWYLHFALVELLKLSGLFTLHATALEKNGYGVLIPGYSGRGKTTSFISLLRSGYRYLADDTPFLRVKGDEVRILSFPMKVDVTDSTICFFPELQDAPRGVLRSGVHKKYFFVEDLYTSGVAESCEPAIILFPRVTDRPRSVLEPLPKSRALEAMLPQALLVYDQELARQEFQDLTKLVQQADCYTLHFGSDVLDLPDLVTPLLETRR